MAVFYVSNPYLAYKVVYPSHNLPAVGVHCIYCRKCHIGCLFIGPWPYLYCPFFKFNFGLEQGYIWLLNEKNNCGFIGKLFAAFACANLPVHIYICIVCCAK